MAVIASIIFTMIQHNISMGESWFTGLFTSGDRYPVGMADKAVPYNGLVLKFAAAGC